MNKKNTLGSRQGFTLLEILAIVVIIGILLGAILVGLKGIRENAEENSLMRTMGTIVRAAGACDVVNYNISTGNICVSGAVATYSALDSKLNAKGYRYFWSSSEKNVLIGYRNSDPVIKCYVESGSCEKL